MDNKNYEVFGDVLAAAHVGTWKIEVDDGREPRMYADATMRDLLGIKVDAQLSPEEVYHAWYDRIDPAHYDAFAEGVDHMLTGEHAEIQYPWHHPDGRTIVVRCGGIRDRRYTAGARAVGIHQWVTTMKHVDRKLEEQQRRLAALAALSKQCISVFDVDLKTGLYETIKHPDTTKAMDREDRRWDVALGRDFAAECLGETRKIVEKIGSVEFIRNELRGADHREYAYSHQLKVGGHVYRRCTILAMERDDAGEATHALVDFVAIDDNQAKVIEQEKVIQEQQRMLRFHAFSNMINAASWSIDISAEGELTRVNWSDELRHMLGFEGEGELPNVFESLTDRLHPEDREQVLEYFWDGVRSEDEANLVYDVIFRIRCKNGEYRWLHSFGRIERNADGTRKFYGLVTDISAEKELELRNARFDTLRVLVNAGFWSFELNAADEVVSVEYSDRFAEFLNVDERLAETGPDVWKSLVHPEDREAAFAAFSATIADHSGNTPYDIVYRMADRNGKYNWYHSAGSVIRRKDGTGEFFGIQINVTKTMEKELEQQRQMEEVQALEKANKAKSYFFSMVSHDIRTPLNAIIGYAELLKLGMANVEEQKKAIDSVLVSGRTLLELINDVLDLSKLEAGKMEILPEPVDPKRLVEEVADAFRASIGGKPVEILTDTGPMPWLKLDPHRVRQILFNLVGNAVKFTEKGHVAIKAEYVPGEEGNGTFRFAVNDTGCGISEEDQQRVAQPYVQVGIVASRGKGTGLGLAICKQLVARMGGEFKLDSTLGEGSTFTVTIPEVEEAENARRAMLSATQRIRLAVDGESLTDLRVLVADDVMMNRMVLKTMLKKFGIIDVEMADNGFSALKKLQEEGPFDLVLTDMWMPGMDGERLVRAIRQNPSWAKLPVYAVTADIEAQKAYCEMGFSGLLLKPLTFEKLKDFFRENIQKR